MTDNNERQDCPNVAPQNQENTQNDTGVSHSKTDDGSEDPTLHMLAGMSGRKQRKFLKHLRKQQRVDKWARFRGLWIDRAIDRPLPESVQTRLPAWIETRGGRLAVIGLGALVLVLWIVILVWVIS